MRLIPKPAANPRSNPLHPQAQLKGVSYPGDPGLNLFRFGELGMGGTGRVYHQRLGVLVDGKQSGLFINLCRLQCRP